MERLNVLRSRLVRIPVTAEARVASSSEGIAAATRSMAMGLLVLAIAALAAAIPALYQRLAAPPDGVREALAAHGIPVGAYAAYLTGIQLIFGITCVGVAALLLLRAGSRPMAVLAVLLLALLGAANPPTLTALTEQYPLLAMPAWLAQTLLMIAVVLFLALFPDGRPAPRWVRPWLVAWVAATVITAPMSRHSFSEPSPVAAVLVLGGMIAGGAIQMYRFARISTWRERQQSKWVVLGIVAAVLGQLAGALLASIPSPLTSAEAAGTPFDAVSVTVVTTGYLCLPIAIGIAVAQARLWDIDLLISRTLLYGALTVSVVGLYALVVVGSGALFATGDNLFISLLATGLVAVLFQPLRERLQRGVNHLLYGDRDDPYAVLTRLGRRLEATLEPNAVLPAVVGTVTEALRLPYAAVARYQDTRLTLVAEAGTPTGDLLQLPLTYQGEPVGELRVAPRGPGEAFSPTDRRLLDDLARQAGVAAHAVQLTADLQRARGRLVSAREEERRRLRRNLHDGLGPQLASQALALAAARKLVSRDPAAADALLGRLAEQAQAAVVDIRRLVHDLRPPALDDLGLVGALREGAARYEQTGLHVAIDAPASLPPLPAAVEVAAYRIVQEALTNVARHAGARTCVIRLAVDPEARALVAEVEDDGRGLPADRRAGVGLTSMRERAEELGGTCVIGPAPNGGTRVAARLPLPEAP